VAAHFLIGERHGCCARGAWILLADMKKLIFLTIIWAFLSSLLCAQDPETWIPEESGEIRNIIIQRGSGIENFKKRYKVSPLMPVFVWEKISFFLRCE
jgi:hypothetical protein